MATMTATTIPHSPGSKSFEVHVDDLNAFELLVQDLSDVLGPTSGLDSNEIDHKELEELLLQYRSETSEWQNYALADYSRSYTRNLVDAGNGKFNLLILVWTPGKGSPIHDHADAHCVMKILRGSLKETLYDWPDKNQVSQGVSCPPIITKETIYGENEVTYMSDKLGLHAVSNPDPERVAVSLHLYTPPHAATRGCHIFCPKTGKPSKVMQCQFSEFGKRC